MKQEDKELLLKDLCARLPYGVKVESIFINPDTKERKSCGIEVFDATSILMIRDGLGEFKPYLFPISSMTEELRREQEAHFTCIKHDMSFSICRYIEWCYKNHLDINGLIPKGLAIDATGKNIY